MTVVTAAPYDYEVEYVKSSHGSVVKTDLLPESGLTFRIELMFEGPFNQIFGGKFDQAKQTTAFFGQEDAEDSEGFRNLYNLALGGHEAQAYQTFVSLGRKSRDRWIHCGLQEVNDAVIGSRIAIVYDGRNVSWGSFRMKLEGERTATGKVPVSFFGMTCADGTPKSYACYDMSLYGASFYRDGKQVAEFVPVVKGGVAGLYEKVTKKFYASATDVPLTAGPKAEKKDKAKAKVKGKEGIDFSVPVFEDDFTNPKVFAERWDFRGHAQKEIEVKDGAVRVPSGNTGDGIQWKGELPDECAVEADFVCYPEWSKIKDPKDGDYHWASMGCDYGNYGVRSDGYGVSLYAPAEGQATRSCYPWIANFKEGEPVTVRFERRRIGDKMMGYTFLINVPHQRRPGKLLHRTDAEEEGRLRRSGEVESARHRQLPVSFRGSPRHDIRAAGRRQSEPHRELRLRIRQRRGAAALLQPQLLRDGQGVCRGLQGEVP